MTKVTEYPKPEAAPHGPSLDFAEAVRRVIFVEHMTPLQSFDPFHRRLLEEHTPFSDAEVERRLTLAERIFASWSALSMGERANHLQRIASLLREETDALAPLMCQEMGKPISEARAEIQKCALVCDYFAEHAESMLARTPLPIDGHDVHVRYHALGGILAIMPWNFPFWQVFRFGAPALMAGNVMLVKHAPQTTRCMLAIEDLIRRAGLPEGAVSALVIEESRVASVLKHPFIRAVTLTGSDRAGRAVAALAGQHLKKCVLELGGSDPFIVLDDADVDRAAEQGMKARCLNTGQSCIAAKRFLVHRDVVDRFTEALEQQLLSLRTGDPLADETDLGPLARRDLHEALLRQTRASIDLGGKVICGGTFDDPNATFFPATLLRDPGLDAPAFHEELFGPVASIFTVDSDEMALDLANRSRFGLGASVWTKDPERAEPFVNRLQSGMVYVNRFPFSDPKVPFGGVKDSGFGRELGPLGIREFVNAKTVWLE